jgi:hypothetical protein
MKRLCLFLLLCASITAIYAQDVVASYNLSRISSYVKIDSITPNTFSILNDSIVSLRKQYHSSDFVIDMLNAKGDYGMNAVLLADSLSTCNYRFALLVGLHSEGAASQVAMFMRRAGKAVVVGAPTADGLMPDIVFDSDDGYLTQWYDSICEANIIQKAVEKYVSSKDVQKVYKNADDLLENFKDNGVMIDIINEVAAENGIKENKDAFYYSGYTLLAETRAELIKQVYPDDRHTYFKALNVPVQQAIHDAMEVIESADYRKIISGNR